MSRVVIAPGTQADLEPLERDLPTGAAQVHRAHLHTQETGATAYLVAWQDGRALGSGVIRWMGPGGERARRRYAGTPEIAHLQVGPACRGQGVGTALVRAAEELIRGRGHRWAAIGVGLDNPSALELYLRLGYRRTDAIDTVRYTWIDESGGEHPEVEDTLLLVKGLALS